MSFVHLHNHTQYSALDGACRIDKMIDMAIRYEMPAVAMTDHGNMSGAIEFYRTATKNGIKPVVGIEAYVIDGDYSAIDSKKMKRHHLVLLAKDLTGYKNLIKLSSISYTEGFYYKPRISKELLKKYTAGIICLSACVQGEIASLLLSGREADAEESVHWYQSLFPGSYYLEIMDHGLADEKQVMPEIIKLAHKTGTPLVVTNDCHYLARQDAKAHDILLCIQTGKTINDPERLRYDTEQLYFKSEEEMRLLFPELPEAYNNTLEIASQIDLVMEHDKFLLPKVIIPEQYKSGGEYLKALCYREAEKKYPQLDDKIKERIDYELGVISRMGFEDYFLVVRDLIAYARSKGISVGPGRGSAAGSIISYLLDITRVCPIEYNLLFERFLNPDRIEMPDIDIDFCAERRGEVIEYLVNNYGRESVAQIITFTTLGAKSVIKDVARVLGIAASEANQITKLMSSVPKATLEQCLADSREFTALMDSTGLHSSILAYSKVIEGLIRQTGVHAAGVVIGPGNLSEHVPLATCSQKGSQNTVLVQYEGKWLDSLKLLKMDVLGLKTLTTIQKALQMVKESRGIEIEIDAVPLDDKKVYELFSQGLTDGIFQFESAGMKKYLKELKPNMFSDLVAMVALYRPGPMNFIDTFILRKYGKETVSYDHPLTENALKETYGVIIYQEQVMQISREMCGFTGGEADTLRKAMGKKIMEVMNKLKPKFIDGAVAKSVPEKVAVKVWDKCVDFANYAFNKSHSVCYAYVAFQTAYLKAHYPAEFMASLLSEEKDPAKIPYFLEECRNMDIEIIPPDINCCAKEFIVRENKILFGLRGLKNVGDVAISKIIEEREKNGLFKDFFELCSRIDLMAVNRTVLESLICSGALDGLEGNRAQKLAVLDCAIEYGHSVSSEKKKGQTTLFDMLENSTEDDGTPDGCKPFLPDIPEMTMNEKLEKEKAVLGYYISGHPLYKYKLELKLFTNFTTKHFNDKNVSIPPTIVIPGVLNTVIEKKDSKNNPYLIASMEDMYGRYEVAVFDDDVTRFRSILRPNSSFVVFGKYSSYRRNNHNPNNGNDSEMLRITPQKIVPIDNMANSFQGKIELSVDEKDATTRLFDDLKEVCVRYPGSFRINLRVNTENFGCLQLAPQKLEVYPRQPVLNRLKELSLTEPEIAVL